MANLNTNTSYANPYVPTVWEQTPSVQTPVNATNLNHIENGIKSVDDSLQKVSTSLDIFSSSFCNETLTAVLSSGNQTGNSVITLRKAYKSGTIMLVPRLASQLDLYPITWGVQVISPTDGTFRLFYKYASAVTSDTTFTFYVTYVSN